MGLAQQDEQGLAPDIDLERMPSFLLNHIVHQYHQTLQSHEKLFSSPTFVVEAGQQGVARPAALASPPLAHDRFIQHTAEQIAKIMNGLSVIPLMDQLRLQSLDLAADLLVEAGFFCRPGTASELDHQ